MLLLALTPSPNFNAPRKEESESHFGIDEGKTYAILAGRLYKTIMHERVIHLKVLGYQEETGWMDPYYRLAAYWAPTIYQYTYSYYTKGDYITSFNYDGDWVGNNNWENLESYSQLWAHVYYAVMETETHYFIFYMLFHPRDWSAALPYFDEHENDMEGAMLVISKDGTKYGSLLIMETRAHTDFYQYSSDPNITSGSDDVDGPIVCDVYRPCLYVEAQGHGVYGDADRVDNLYSYDGIITYRFENNNTEYPTSGDDENVSYALLSILKFLWPRRYDMGDGSTYDQPFLYQGARFSFVNEIPAAFDGDNGSGDDKANPPWGMDDGNDGDVYQGDWFFDPAYTVYTHLIIPYNFSLNYTYNPYLIEEGPEFNPPVIDVYSPQSYEYVLDSNVNISWNVSDEFDIFNISVYIDGNIIYTGKSKGYNEIHVGLSDGKHALNICAVDIWGNYRWVYREFYVDTKPPILDILDPKNNSYHNASEITIEWSTWDENGVERVEIYVDNSLYDTVPGSVTNYEVSVGEGQHIIRLVSWDNAGRSSEEIVNIITDLTPPSIDVLSPENNSQMMYDDNVTIKWNASDNQGIDHYEVRIDNQSWINVYKNESIEFFNLSLYNHVVYIKAIDLAGNIEVAMVNFSLNPSEPILTNANENASVAIISASDIVMCWSIEGDYDHVELIIDNSEVIDVGKRTNYVFRNLGEGLHNITIRVFYPAGDCINKTYRIMVDRSQPQIYSLSCTPVDATDNNTVIRWEASDGLSGIEHYEIRIDSGAWIFVGNNTEFILDASGLQDGYHLIILRAYDMAGNVAQRAMILIVDRIAPTIEILHPQNNTYIASRTIVISIRATDNMGIRAVEILLNNSLVLKAVFVETITIENLSDGNNILTVKVYDYGGNVEEKKIVFDIDTTPPNLRIIAPRDTEQINGSSMDVEWTCDEECTYYIRLDDSEWIYNENKTFYTFYNVGQGVHVIYVIAKDKANNTICQTTIVVVEPQEKRHYDVLGRVYLGGNHSISIVANDIANRTANATRRFAIDLSIELMVPCADNGSWINRSWTSISWTIYGYIWRGITIGVYLTLPMITILFPKNNSVIETNTSTMVVKLRLTLQ